jgi:hypothetical protein
MIEPGARGNLRDQMIAVRQIRHSGARTSLRQEHPQQWQAAGHAKKEMAFGEHFFGTCMPYSNSVLFRAFRQVSHK